MREEPPITHETLRAFLLANYGIDAESLTFLPVGDTHSAIYRVETPGESFLLKLRPSFDEARLRASRLLLDNGITEVIAPVATTSGALSATIESFATVLFPYVEGKTGWDAITDAHWREAGRIIRRIHSLAVEESAIPGLTREAFNSSGYADAIDGLEAQLPESTPPNTALDLLGTTWRKHQLTIHALTNATLKLADILKSQSLPLVICHADLHPGNLLRNNERVFVIDWDDVMLAPKERDFIFTGEPADGTAPASPFFDGYGSTEVNWTAVTYYRYERVVTDLIEYALDVVSRDALSEDTKLHSAGRFVQCLQGRNFAAAEVAAEHLPRELAYCAVHRTK